MGKNDFATILGIGAVGIGGYLFVTQIWPMMRSQLEDIGGGYEEEEEERMIPPMIVEDRIPDVVVYEDRYPDYYPAPYPQPYPVPVPTYPYPSPYPPYCSPGRYWNGERCKKIEIDCPPGYREDDGVCKPRKCDKDEVFDGRRCIKIPKIRIPKIIKRGSRDWKKGDRDWDRDKPRIPIPIPRRKKDEKPPEVRFGSSRDRWNADREVEEKMSGKDNKESTPETDRLEEITEKAVQSFIEIWEY